MHHVIVEITDALQGARRLHSGCTPPTGQRLGSALMYQRRTSASGTGPVQSNVAVKTRRQQTPSAPVQRRRRLQATTERSRNQADLQQQKQSPQQAVSCREAQCSCSRWHLPPLQCRQTTVGTLFGSGSQLQLQRRQQLKRQQPLRRRRRRQPKRQPRKHPSSGEESRGSIHWNSTNFNIAPERRVVGIRPPKRSSTQTKTQSVTSEEEKG